MEARGELAGAQDTVQELIADYFGEKALADLEKGKTFLFELADYDSRFDEENAGWEDAVASLDAFINKLRVEFPLGVMVSDPLGDDDPILIEESDDLARVLMDLCIELLPIELDGEEGDSAVTAVMHDGDLTCKLVLTGEFESWVETDRHNQEETLDSGMVLKIRRDIEFSKREQAE